MRKRDSEKTRREVIRALAMVLQIGLSMLVCMAISLGIGYYLDRLFGTRFIIIIFMAIGFMASIRSMLVLTGRYKPGEKEENNDKKDTV